VGKREQAIRLWRAQRRQKQATIRRNRGILGDGAGNLRVPGRSELVFMRVNGDPNRIWKVINDAVADTSGLPVIIEKDPDSPLWRVIAIDRGSLSMSGIGFDNMKRMGTHHEEHEWPAGGPGGDAVTVFPRAIHDLRTEPTSTYTEGVLVRPLIYSYEGVSKVFLGSLEPLATYIPASGIKRVLTYLDVRTNKLQVSPGETITYTSTSNPPRPSIPWYARPSAFVKVYQGQTAWVEADIEDARDIIGQGKIRHRLQQERDPATNDDAALGYSAGSMWINRLTDTIWVCTDATIGTAIWIETSSSGSVFADDVFRIEDDIDATKEIAFQAANITTATTRTITMPDQNVDLTPGTGSFLAAPPDFLDTLFRIQDDGDTTKEIAFQAANIATATTRTITMPNQDVDLTPASGTFPGIATANTFAAAQKVNVNSVAALHIEQDGVNNDVLVVDTSNSRIGFGITPSNNIDSAVAGGSVFQLGSYSATASHEAALSFLKSSSATLGTLTTTAPAENLGTIQFQGVDSDNAKQEAANIIVEQQAASASGFVPGRIIIGVSTASAANIEVLRLHGNLAVFNEDGADINFRIESVNQANIFRIDAGLDRIGINSATPAALLHIDQLSTTAAIPVLYLDQADVSEEMIEFNTTIGTGNAIEAVGAKTLTTTHFIKVTIPGGLTRYIPIGTIA
jgi:hypothetical protein